MEVITEALAWVNEARGRQGRSPLPSFPPGVPCDPSACPVSLALDATVTFDGLAVPRDGLGRVVRLPAAVQRFANEFDVGLHPALEQPTRVLSLV